MLSKCTKRAFLGWVMAFAYRLIVTNIFFLREPNKSSVRFGCLLVLFCGFSFSPLIAQRPTTRPIANAPRDSVVAKRDSIVIALPDSLKKKDGVLEAMVKYTARDSIIMSEDQKIVYLYGDAKVEYSDINLKAEYIQLDYSKNEMFARGVTDSLKGNKVGFPIFKQGESTYNADSIRYNFKTKKAIIKSVVTQQGEGFVQGKQVKKDDEDNLYLRRGIYTTCDLAHPHFFIAASKLKIAQNKKKGTKQVVAGPFNLVINDIPLPIGLPFGFFPFPKQKEQGTSGIIFPKYGEEPRGRGFYLRDGGYYFAISEYIGVQVLGQIYSKGGWGLGTTGDYRKLYRYNGNFSLQFNRNTTGDEARPNPTNDFRVQWSHTPVTHGNHSFSASVNASTNGYNARNAFNTQQYLQSAVGSSVSYSQVLGNIGRAGASLRLNQNVSSKTVDASTDFNFGVNQFTPLKRKNAVTTSQFAEQFRLALDFSGSYSVNNQIQRGLTQLPFNVKVSGVTSTRDTILPVTGQNLPELLRNARFTGRYSIPLTLPNFKVLRFINVTPGFNYQGEIFTRKFRYTYVPSDTAVKIDTTRGLFSSYNYGFSVSANTRIYGTFYFKKLGRIQAIRHVMAPSISFGATPDFSKARYGMYQWVQVNQKRDSVIISRYGSASGSPGASGSISFSIQNTLEAKLRSKSDTAAKQSEKINLLDNFSVGGSYNLLADSLRLSDLSFAATTNLLKRFNVNFNAIFDPYLYVKEDGYFTGKKVDKFLLIEERKLAALKAANFSVSTSFQPRQAREKKKQSSPNATPAQTQFVQNNPDLYLDWEVPWNLNVSYQWSYTKTGLAPKQTVSSATFNGDLSLTQKWKFTFSSGYDFAQKVITYTNIGITRNLHCWDMSFNWTPAAQGARANTYSFDLYVKSAILKDLKISRRRTFYDRGVF